MPKNYVFKAHENESAKFSDGIYSYAICGLKKSQNNNEWKVTQDRDDLYKLKILSYKQLNNQNLALITTRGIFIYTIVEDFLSFRYFWNNEKWNNFYKKIKDEDKKEDDKK